MILFLYGAIIMRLICMRQIDLRILVAYSSVVHIRLGIGRIFSLSIIGVKGAILIIIAHGFCSSGLFFFLNCMYERMGSRSFYLLRGGFI